MITKRGRELRLRLNQATGEFISFEQQHATSLLARRLAAYQTLQENRCSYEWANTPAYDRREERLEASITELAVSLPGVVGVLFDGDPRGYTCKLVLCNGRSNTLGGEGWGFDC